MVYGFPSVIMDRQSVDTADKGCRAFQGKGDRKIEFEKRETLKKKRIYDRVNNHVGDSCRNQT